MTSETKRFHPAFVFGVLVFPILLVMVVSRVAGFMEDPGGEWMALVTMLAVLVSHSWLLKVLFPKSWRIQAAGDHVVLSCGDKRLYQGAVDDLSLLHYDYGVLHVESKQGDRFSFPAFGMMRRFIRDDSDAGDDD